MFTGTYSMLAKKFPRYPRGMISYTTALLCADAVQAHPLEIKTSSTELNGPQIALICVGAGSLAMLYLFCCWEAKKWFHNSVEEEYLLPHQPLPTRVPPPSGPPDRYRGGRDTSRPELIRRM